MWWSRKPKQVYPAWRPFNGASYERAEALGLGPGDGISVRVTTKDRFGDEVQREIGMDLMMSWPDAFCVKDPNGTEYIYSWSDAVSYWRRII